MGMAGTIVIAGALAQKAGQGGLSWVYLQYLLGFRRLGFDVLFVDWLRRDMCTNAAGDPCEPEGSVNAAYVRTVMDGFGLGNAFVVLDKERSVVLR